MGRLVPRRKGSAVLGSTIEFQNDQLGFMERGHAEYGDVFCTKIAGLDWYFCRDPEIIHEINVRRARDFMKPKLAKRMWKLFLGDGLVPNDGEHWKKQHDLLKPGFHRRRIDAYGPTMVEYTQSMIRRYTDGEEVDTRKDINRLALAIVGKTLFNADVEGDADAVFDAMEDIGEMLVEHINLPLPTPRWWPSPGNQRKVGAIEAIEFVIKKLIAQRLASGQDGGDLLSHMVFARAKDGTKMSAKELRDEAMTLIFAGHETTAHAMTWTWYLLARHPHVAEKLHAEVAAQVGSGSITVADLDKLPYLTQVMKESLRLMPSVWMYARAPKKDMEIKGYFFPEQCSIFISPYILGRESRWHPEPLSFTPERWTREYERGLPKGAFVPFAAGPRVCLGQGFAQMEMRLIIGTMIHNLVPQLLAGFEPNLIPEISLHPGTRGLQTLVRIRADAPLFVSRVAPATQAPPAPAE